MQFQTILCLLAATATPMLATPLSLEYNSLQPRSIQSESCQHMGVAIDAVMDRLDDDDCDAKCKTESNKALEALMSVQKEFPCAS
ncbi:hypothetical protein HO133_001101 [Letharia lupina]|uniref:Uncharacterized protein n=1 Tax=Letharia lupina TaxID=560253 RepID=A0A8H6CGE6_9LECA|nr:uncharacterized protein HO133_001101 [Letharia lupina]KAF6223049.1 hypothetical protein HO133_001101 [Letharia lupina]